MTNWQCVYLVQFVRYWTSNNGVPFKPSLAIIQGHWQRRHSIDHTTCCQSAVVTIGLLCTIFEIFDVEEYHDPPWNSGLESLTLRIYTWNLRTRGYLFTAIILALLQSLVHSEPRKKLHNVRRCVAVVQAHSRLSKLVPIESPYAISY